MRRELEPVRSVHQAFGHGLLPGLLFAGAAMVTRGRWLADLPGRAGHRRMRTLRWYYGIEMASPAREPRPCRRIALLTFDKLTNVHFSGTAHDEDQPVHLLVHTEVCSSICGPEYGHPCTRFCPANVYEIVRDDGRGAAAADQRVELRALQDVRHHGSLRRDHVGAAGGRRRTAVHGHVMASDWRASRLKRLEAAAIAGLGYPVMAALGHTLRWRTSGLHHLDAIRAAGHQPVMAFWHGRILPATFYFRRRGIVVITSENFDGEWIARIIERFGYGTARGSTSSGGKRALLQLVRDMKSGPAGRLHARRSARSGTGGAAGRRVAGDGHRQPAAAVPPRSVGVVDGAELGSDAGAEAVQHGGRWRVSRRESRELEHRLSALSAAGCRRAADRRILAALVAVGLQIDRRRRSEGRALVLTPGVTSPGRVLPTRPT